MKIQKKKLYQRKFKDNIHKKFIRKLIEQKKKKKKEEESNKFQYNKE